MTQQEKILEHSLDEGKILYDEETKRFILDNEEWVPVKLKHILDLQDNEYFEYEDKIHKIIDFQLFDHDNENTIIIPTDKGHKKFPKDIFVETYKKIDEVIEYEERNNISVSYPKLLSRHIK